VGGWKLPSGLAREQKCCRPASIAYSSPRLASRHLESPAVGESSKDRERSKRVRRAGHGPLTDTTSPKARLY